MLKGDYRYRWVERSRYTYVRFSNRPTAKILSSYKTSTICSFTLGAGADYVSIEIAYIIYKSVVMIIQVFSDENLNRPFH